LRGLKYVRDDGVFRRTLISWMILGFANLMMLPLRIEFLANPAHGVALRPDQVALLTAVIPNAARLVLSPLWGWAFDRMNFFTMRVSVNCGLGLYILAFFASDSQTGLIVGAVLYGASQAGGDVAWSLWVTKLAPPDRVADYMGVHTLFTGIRGVAAPLLAFYAAAHVSLSTLAWGNAVLIVIANLVLLPDLFEQRWKAAPKPLPGTL
jgi:MFS family permease